MGRQRSSHAPARCRGAVAVPRLPAVDGTDAATHVRIGALAGAGRVMGLRNNRKRPDEAGNINGIAKEPEKAGRGRRISFGPSIRNRPGRFRHYRSAGMVPAISGDVAVQPMVPKSGTVRAVSGGVAVRLIMR